MPALHEIIQRPVVTEKSSAAYQLRKEYAFRVHPGATKPQIKAAIEQLFRVKVRSIRTMQMRRNEVVRGRKRGATAAWKKAVVILREGDTIPVFEG
ncbi:MAG TPA: 50S ribosomal protein L23 [Gemmatimonadales bacterium]|jgi:large subunit ribosomal protein L23|nr:50S ribosomal protein L23 [Gemmatimonadales bacterium]